MTVADAIEKLRALPQEATVQVNPGGKFTPRNAIAIALRLDGKPVADNVPLEHPARYRVELW